MSLLKVSLPDCFLAAGSYYKQSFLYKQSPSLESVGHAPVLLPQLVTGITNGGRPVVFVTIYAPLHLYGLLDLDDLLLHDVAVTTLALDLCHRVLTVAEENKVGRS